MPKAPWKSKLTHEEWKAVEPPFYWLDLRQKLDDVYIEMLDKWVDRNVQSWWYRHENGSRIWIIGDKESFIALDFYLKCEPFKDQHGEQI